jgi:hypothetical protein
VTQDGAVPADGVPADDGSAHGGVEAAGGIDAPGGAEVAGRVEAAGGVGEPAAEGSVSSSPQAAIPVRSNTARIIRWILMVITFFVRSEIDVPPWHLPRDRAIV